MAHDTVSEGLQGLFVALTEGIRARREDLEDPHKLSPIPQGNNEDGTDTEKAAGGGINAGIGFSVVAALQGAHAEALGGKSGFVETNAQVRRGAAGSSAANHFAV